MQIINEEKCQKRKLKHTAQLLGSASKIHLQATLFSDIYIRFYRKNHNQIMHEWPERQEKTCCQKTERIHGRSDTRQKQNNTIRLSRLTQFLTVRKRTESKSHALDGRQWQTERQIRRAPWPRDRDPHSAERRNQSPPYEKRDRQSSLKKKKNPLLFLHILWR